MLRRVFVHLLDTGPAMIGECHAHHMTSVDALPDPIPERGQLLFIRGIKFIIRAGVDEHPGIEATATEYDRIIDMGILVQNILYNSSRYNSICQ